MGWLAALPVALPFAEANRPLILALRRQYPAKSPTTIAVSGDVR